MNPKVSIIIPVYNGSDYLASSIASALDQTYKNIEIIVVNDGSTDRGLTDKIAKSFGQKIRYFRKKNNGVASAVNYGLKKMTGKYFSWLSHDDRYLPDKIQAEIDFLKSRPANTIVYSDFNFIDEKGHLIRAVKLLPPKDGQMIYALFLSRFIHGCTLLIPRAAFKLAGDFREDLKNAQDYEMWFRMMRKGFVFRHLAEATVEGRIHAKQGTVTRKQTQLADEELVYTWVLKNFSSVEIFGDERDETQYYLDISLAAKKAGLLAVSELAYQLAMQSRSAENFFYNWLYGHYCQFWTEKITLAYWRSFFGKLLL